MQHLNDQDQHLIGQHLRGQLTEAEKDIFSQKMLHESFREEVKRQAQLLAAADPQSNRDLKRPLEIGDAKDSHTPTTASVDSAPKSNKTLLRILGLGLVVMLICGLLFFVVFPSPAEQYSAEDLYTANFEAYPNVLFPIEQNSDASTISPEQKALQFYQEQEYQSAILAIDSLLENQANDDLLLYQSIAQLASDENSDALINLSQIVENGQTSYLAEARWYLALAYLKIGASDEALIHLQTLAKEEKGFKRNRSKAILALLKEQANQK